MKPNPEPTEYSIMCDGNGCRMPPTKDAVYSGSLEKSATIAGAKVFGPDPRELVMTARVRETTATGQAGRPADTVSGRWQAVVRGAAGALELDVLLSGGLKLRSD